MNNIKSTLKILIFQCMAILSASFIFCSCSVPSNHEVLSDELTVPKDEMTADTVSEITDSATDTNSGSEALSETKDAYLTLESHTIDYEKIKQIEISELKTLDFTDCSIAVLDYWAARIYEYMSEEDVKEFIDRISKAEFAEEEYEGDLLIYDGVGSLAYRFAVTLNTGEILYLSSESIDNIYMILLNGYHGYQCDQSLHEYLEELYQGACYRFLKKADNQ